MNWKKYVNVIDWKKDQAAYDAEEGRIADDFYDDAIADAGLTGHPKASAAFHYAWEHGHATGRETVHGILIDIAELVK